VEFAVLAAWIDPLRQGIDEGAIELASREIHREHLVIDAGHHVTRILG
jgi:hypothetical protein